MSQPPAETEPNPLDEHDGIEVPDDEYYGGNRPIELPASVLLSGQTQTKEKKSLPQNQDEQEETHDTKEKGEISITLLPLLLIITVLGGLGTGLYFTATKLFIPQIFPEFAARHLTAKPKQPATPTSETPPPDIQKTSFIPDHGYYKRSQTYNSAEVLAERTKSIKNNIIWITGEPNNEPFLNILSAVKKRTGIPIYILCGKECQPIRIKRAHDFGFVVYQVEEQLEIPYSFFLLDGKLFIDASREHWIWETTEKKIIKANAAWAQDLINTSKITH